MLICRPFCGRAPACYHNDRQRRLVVLGTCVPYCVGCRPVPRFSPVSPLSSAGAELFLRAKIARVGAFFPPEDYSADCRGPPRSWHSLLNIDAVWKHRGRGRKTTKPTCIM